MSDRNLNDKSRTKQNSTKGAFFSQNILIVDDNLENLRLLSNMLVEQGYTVRKATNGTMTLKTVQTLPPDLILLDIMMPDMDGYDVCLELKANPIAAKIPIIFLSALDDIFDKVRAFAVGGADYISKPFQVEEVLMRVGNQLALKIAQQQIDRLNSQLEERVRERTQQLAIANERLRKIAMYDDLTGIFNRAEFLKQLNKSLSRAKTESAYQFAVLFLDCDRFKVINDSLGHSVGDELLSQIAQRLSGTVRTQDVMARLGGDEFAILLSAIINTKKATDVAEQIIEILKQPFCCRGYEIFINVSIGIVFSNSNYKKPEHLLRDADTAMYRAKDLGGKRYQTFTPTMHRAALQLLKIETDLHKAIEQQEFVVYYQPIINLDTEKIVGFEALVRWLHPKHGLILPHVFLDVAEETGLICEIGKIVTELACDRLLRWQQQGFSTLKIHLNLSAKQLNQATLVAEIDRILAKTEIAPPSIKLEITESSMMQNLKSSDTLLQQLQERGIQLSIDDFGTGYSSLSQIQNLPIHTLKIDRCFIKNLDGTPKNLGLVPVILNIARVMNLEVVAEGIETQEQLTQLQELGCNFGQGFLFAKPLSAEDAEIFLKQNFPRD